MNNSKKITSKKAPKVGRPFVGATRRLHGTVTPEQGEVFDLLGGFSWLRKYLDLSKGLYLENKSKKDLRD